MRHLCVFAALSLGCSFQLDLDGTGADVAPDQPTSDAGGDTAPDPGTSDVGPDALDARTDSARDVRTVDLGSVPDGKVVDAVVPPDIAMVFLPDGPLPDGATDGPPCLDGDGDGFGEGCELGADCDDEDVNAWRLDTGFPDGDDDGFTGPAEQVCAGDMLPPLYRGAPSDEADCDDDDPNAFRQVRIGRDADNDGWTVDDEPACIGERIPDGFATPNDAADCDDGAPTVHPFANERCDGRDTDCDGRLSPWEGERDGGRLACRRALWVRTSSDDEGLGDPDGRGNGGFLEAYRLLDAQVDIEVHWLRGADLGPERLERYGLILFTGAGDARILEPDESVALGDWVDAGGRLMYVSHRASEQAFDFARSLPRSLGLEGRAPLAGSWDGEVLVALARHPLMEDVVEMGVAQGDRMAARDPAVVVAEGEQPFVIASEPERGRFVAFSDSTFLMNEGSSRFDINHGDHRQLVRNTWAWLLDDNW